MERARASYKLSFHNISRVVWVVGTGGRRQDGDRMAKLASVQGLAHVGSMGDGLGAGTVEPSTCMNIALCES